MIKRKSMIRRIIKAATLLKRCRNYKPFVLTIQNNACGNIDNDMVNLIFYSLKQSENE